MAGERMRAAWEGRCAIVVYDGDTSVAKPPYSGGPKYFPLKGWTNRKRSPGLDVSNTEGKPGRAGAALAPGKRAKIKNLGDAEVRLEMASFDDSADPFSTAPGGAGYDIEQGDYMYVILWPNRADAGNVNDVSKAKTYNVMVTELEWSGRVGEGQPVAIVCESDGAFD